MKSVRLLVVFFLLLFLGLFLGDGPQSVIEVYGAAIGLLLWVWYFFWNTEKKDLSSPVFIGWTAVFVAATLSAAFSIDRGLSVSWLVRLGSAFLIFMVFAGLSDKRAAQQFMKGTLVFIVGASVLSVISLLSPLFRSTLPSMNLVSLVYGHNHLADLLIFSLPFLTYYLRSATKPQRLIALFLYVALLFLTFARGAWLIALAYGVYKGRRTIFVLPKRAWLTTGGVIGALVLLGAKFVASGAISKYLLRPNSFDVRLLYWRQAIDGFLQSPLVGNGPGTFSLISRQFQETAISSSWFAHSFPLQTLSDVGTLGVCAFILLFFVLGRAVIIHGEKQEAPLVYAPLIESTLLIAFYSLFEFTLDYFVTWAFFWAMMGLIVGRAHAAGARREAVRIFSAAVAGYTVIFYALWIAGGVTSLVTGAPQKAVVFEPFDETWSVAYFMTPSVSKSASLDRLIFFFHAKNPAVWYAYAEREADKNNKSVAASAYHTSFLLEPMNIEHAKTYLSFVTKMNDDSLLAAAVQGVCTTRSLVCGAEIFFPSFLEAFRVRYQEEAVRGGQISFPDMLQRVFYLSGYDVLSNHQEETRAAWSAAATLDPNWGYYQIELASLNFYLFNDDAVVAKTLTDCIRDKYTAGWCRKYENNYLSLPPVGSMIKNIQAIPEIIH